MSILEIDRKGRLMLPKKLRESLDVGKKVLVINAGDHLKVKESSKIEDLL